jgi:anti-sigma regulatory factor (Ser/Thr protein kinase)
MGSVGEAESQAVMERSGYRHEAFFYGSRRQFLDGVMEFVTGALDAGTPVLLALSPAKLDAVQDRLGGPHTGVHTTDMDELGRNPARIIPAWQDFIAEHGGDSRKVRGIGEPIVPGQSSAKRVECHLHEALLNAAFSGADFWLLCPYDATGLEPGTVEEACRTHPFVLESGTSRTSPSYRGSVASERQTRAPLPPVPAEASRMRFYAAGLPAVRGFVVHAARQAGLDESAAADFVVAANEIATNSLRHGRANGSVAAWSEAGSLICEFRDDGRFEDPLAGRVRPSATGGGGRGLWIANQICDLVQIRTGPTGTVVRLHKAAGART